MKNSKPIIGISMPRISGDEKINTDYFNAVGQSGGISFYINPKSDISDTLKIIDGIILSGGGDFHENFIDEPLDKNAKNIDFERDMFEIGLCRNAFLNRIPILGICRGAQVISLALGGKIIQHIEGHFQKNDRKIPFHAIKILEKSNLFSIVGKNCAEVNSLHHQCISCVPKGFIVSAQSYDGVIEAIEYNCLNLENKYFCMGVQWHPEALFDKGGESEKLFEYFIDSCR